MATQIDLALEGAAALVACEGLEARVLAAVRDQVGRLAERLAADDATVRFLALNSEKRHKEQLDLN